jgi:hypothetical protein
MKFSFQNLTPFLSLFCSCQFRRLDSIQFLCSKVHILAGWRLEARPSTSDSTIRLLSLSTQVEEVTLRLTVNQSVSLGIEPNLGLMTRYLLLFDSYGLVFVGRPLWREDEPVFCIRCWPLLAQSFSGPSSWRLATIFYCLRFETSFSSPPTTRSVTVEVFDPASTRVPSLLCRTIPYNYFARTPQKTQPLLSRRRVYWLVV